MLNNSPGPLKFKKEKTQDISLKKVEAMNSFRTLLYFINYFVADNLTVLEAVKSDVVSDHRLQLIVFGPRMAGERGVVLIEHGGHKQYQLQS